ncbi:MAG: LLM class flavin-dependent oxidoreductase [Chloroflexota bacterium]
MTHPIRIGFLTHVRGHNDPRQVYAETLELFDVAEQLGYDVGWVAQHHFKAGAGFLPSPFPFLAAVAERTQNIRLGTSIIVLPLELPLRVAEDAAVVDLLSNGRLELGVGSGSDPDEFLAFDMDMTNRHSQTTDGLIKLRRAIRGAPLGKEGLTLQPPAPTLLNRMWLSALSIGGAEYAAQHEMGLMLSRAAWGHDEPTDVVQLGVAKAFLDQWDKEDESPRIGLSRGVYVSQSKQHALNEIREPVMKAANARVKTGQLPSDLSLERYCEYFHIAYGSPEEVAKALSADKVLPYATDLILQFDPVFPPQERVIQMMERIAAEVVPNLSLQNGYLAP